MALRRKKSTSGIGALAKKVASVNEKIKKTNQAKRAIEKKLALERRLEQKITALKKAQNALKITGIKARAKRKTKKY